VFKKYTHNLTHNLRVGWSRWSNGAGSPAAGGIIGVE